MKYLYSYKASLESTGGNGINCKVFTPKLGGLFLPGEVKSAKQFIVRLLFQLMTLGEARIFYVSNECDLIHTSYVIPKCCKFPFLGEEDYEIGPCYTYPEYRGKGIYPAVLQEICSHVGSQSTTFYMIVNEDNLSSIKGIEKAGFRRCGTIKVTRLTKRYLLKM